MLSSPLDSTDGRTTLGIAWYHNPWTAHTIRLHHALHANITLGLHIHLDDIRSGMHPWPLCSTICQTTSGVVCHHRPRKAYAVGLHWACHVIISLGHNRRLDHIVWYACMALGQHTRSDDARRGMPSMTSESTDYWTTSGVRGHHCPYIVHTVRLRWAWHAINPLDRSHRWMTSRMACDHHFWKTNTNERRRVDCYHLLCGLNTF